MYYLGQQGIHVSLGYHYKYKSVLYVTTYPFIILVLQKFDELCPYQQKYSSVLLFFQNMPWDPGTQDPCFSQFSSV